MKFVFFGTADFGLPTLQSLIDAGHSVSAVVTNPPKPAGRGLKLRKSPVHLYCEDRDIAPVLTPDSLKDPEFLETLKEFEADIFVVVAFSILPEVLFSIPPKGTYNIHAALLPNFRGPAPIQRAIETGAKESGVTLFRIDRGVDTGNIILQKKVEIEDRETTPSLYEKLSQLGGVVIAEGFSAIENSTVTYSEQDHSVATKAPLLHKSEGEINWSESAEQIDRRIRAFQPFPGCYTELNGKRLVITAATAINDSCGQEAGTIVECKENLVIACGEGILDITEIKPAGKRAMPVRDFLNGSQLSEGDLLG